MLAPLKSTLARGNKSSLRILGRKGAVINKGIILLPILLLSSNLIPGPILSFNLIAPIPLVLLCSDPILIFVPIAPVI